MGHEEPGDPHSIIKEWGGSWGVPRAVPEPEPGQSEMYIKFLCVPNFP
jgi:hypothetical protein